MKVQIIIMRIPIHEESAYVKPREVSIIKQHHMNVSNTTWNNETALDGGEKRHCKILTNKSHVRLSWMKFLVCRTESKC